MSSNIDASQLDPDIFVQAAELVEETGFACCAIDQATGRISNPDVEDPHHAFFGETFRPASAPFYQPFFSYDESGNWDDRGPELHQQARILALLLCAELVRDARRMSKKPAREDSPKFKGWRALAPEDTIQPGDRFTFCIHWRLNEVACPTVADASDTIATSRAGRTVAQAREDDKDIWVFRKIRRAPRKALR